MGADIDRLRNQLHTTDCNSPLVEPLLCLFQRRKLAYLDMMRRAMRALKKQFRLTDDDHLHITESHGTHLFHSKSTCTADHVSNVVVLGDIGDDEVSFRFLLFHRGF